MLDAARRTTELNPGKLPELFKKQFQLCNVKPGETIAIVSDLGTREEYIHAAFAAADALGADIYEMRVNMIPGWTKVGVPTIGKCKGTGTIKYPFSSPIQDCANEARRDPKESAR